MLKKAPLTSTASGRKEAMDEPQQEAQRQPAEEGAKTPSIFQLANQEFEDHEWESERASPSRDMLSKHPEPRMSEEASVSDKVCLEELLSLEDPDVPQSQPSSEHVAMAMEDMKHFMEAFGVDLATVTQAFLKTSGEVAAVAHCLQTALPSQGCPPLWTRQDDQDLLAGDDSLRSQLIAKYGEEKVKRRVAFRRN